MRALVLSTAAFLTNRRGYPALTKAHQQLLLSFWRQGVQVRLWAVSGMPLSRVLPLFETMHRIQWWTCMQQSLLYVDTLQA